MRSVLGRFVDRQVARTGSSNLNWHTATTCTTVRLLPPHEDRGRIATTVALLRRNGTVKSTLYSIRCL